MIWNSDFSLNGMFVVEGQVSRTVGSVEKLSRKIANITNKVYKL